MSEVALAGLSVAIGDVVLGRYRVEGLIGEGGAGIVLAAIDVGSGERVAVKLLRRALETDELRTRFAREARATGKLASEHVVRLIDAGALDDGAPVMVMELLNGRDLARVIHEDGCLPPEQAVDCMIQVCEVLCEAHARGIVHRDLKPANLFLTCQEPGRVEVKVLDFGISKILDKKFFEEDGRPEVTVPFTMLGSPRYMAPEQVRNSKDVDGRADLWSVGAVLFQLVTGVHAFEATGSVQASVAVLTAEPRSFAEFAPHAPVGLGDVVRRCLAKDPEQRFQTAGDLAAALRPFSSRVGTSTVPLPRFAPTPAPAPARDGAPSVPVAPALDARPPPPPPSSAGRTRTAPMPAVRPSQVGRLSTPGSGGASTVEAWGRSDAPPPPAKARLAVRLLIGGCAAAAGLVLAAGVFASRLPTTVRSVRGSDAFELAVGAAGAGAGAGAAAVASASPSVGLDAGRPTP